MKRYDGAEEKVGIKAFLLDSQLGGPASCAYSNFRWCVPWSLWEGTWWRGDRDSFFSKVKNFVIRLEINLALFQLCTKLRKFYEGRERRERVKRRKKTCSKKLIVIIWNETRML